MQTFQCIQENIHYCFIFAPLFSPSLSAGILKVGELKTLFLKKNFVNYKDFLLLTMSVEI